MIKAIELPEPILLSVQKLYYMEWLFKIAMQNILYNKIAQWQSYLSSKNFKNSHCIYLQTQLLSYEKYQLPHPMFQK